MILCTALAISSAKVVFKHDDVKTTDTFVLSNAAVAFKDAMLAKSSKNPVFEINLS